MLLEGKQEREYDQKLFESIQLLIIMKRSDRRDCFLAECRSLSFTFHDLNFLLDLNQYSKVRMQKYIR